MRPKPTASAVRRVLAQLIIGAILVSCGDPKPLEPGGSAPVATIITPAAGASYQGGSTIQFSGSAVDVDGSPLPASALTWWAEFHHDGITTVAAPVTGGATGALTVPTNGETSANVFYRFFLRAVDGGRADTVSRDVTPQTMQLTVTSAGPGRALTLDGNSQAAPFSVTAVVGVEREIGAPSPQVANDSTYTFQSWSDGGAQTHRVTPQAGSTTYTATFSVTGPVPTGPPIATMSTPVAGAIYSAGTSIQYSGSAQDGTGAPLPASSLSWWAEFHHDGQVDVALPVTSGASGSVAVPTTGTTSTSVFYRFFLRAVDSHGVADTVSRDVLPRTVQITLSSSPSGRTLTLDGQSQVAPFTVTGVVGLVRQVGVPSPQSSGDSTYTYQSWSDGGAQSHGITTPASNTTYTANFSAAGPPPVPPPTALITTPAAGATYRGGQTIQFSGSAQDGSGASLPGSALSWWAEFHHDGLTDPFLPVTGGASGSVVIPTTGVTSVNVFYRFYLRAVDAQGVADTVFRDVLPQTVQLTVTATPAGRTISVDGQSHLAPFTFSGVVGMVRQIGTTSPQTSNDSTFTFQSWSDGGGLAHAISTPTTNTTYTATFSAAGPPPSGPPVATIAQPAAGSVYRGGQAVQFSGSAQDAAGTPLTGSALSWWVTFHHSGLIDTLKPVTTGGSGTFTIPTTGDVSTSAFYRFSFRAIDSHGVADTVSRDITPQTMQLTLTSLGVGRTVTLDGVSQTAPFTATVVVGVIRVIGTPSPQTVGDSTYTFQSWSDGGGQTHNVSPPVANTTYTATFSAAGPPPVGSPTAAITAPAPGATYRAGQAIQLLGNGQSSTGSALPVAALSWWVDFHHDGQVSSFEPVHAGSGSGSVLIPTTGETSANVFYRFYVRAVENGVADTVFRDLLPQTVQVTITATPAGRTIILDGVSRPAPFSFTGVIGIVRQIGTTTPQTSNDSTFTFQSWSDGGSLSHAISTPTTSTTYTATFSAAAPLPPTATITSPASGATYAGGSTIQFTGSGKDGNNVALPVSALSWWVNFHHNGQIDAFEPVHPGSGTGTVVIPTTGETSANVFYRFYLRVVDTHGAVDTVFRDVLPQTVQLTFTSSPVGRTLSIDGSGHTAPYVVTGVVGIVRQLNLTSPQSSNDSTFTFTTWSDGGAQAHAISTPAGNTTYTANFSVLPPQPPTAVISAPLVGATYHGGSTINYAGSATDMNGTPLTGTSLSWWAELHHDDHTHPFIPVTPGASGSTVIPSISEVSSNVFYRFYFRAVDSHGLADTLFRDVLPEKIQLTITSNPVGRTITLDGQPQTAPYTVTGVVGIQRELGAPSPQTGGTDTYTFQSWSDGQSQTHLISTPATNTTYTATYTVTGPANLPPTVSITAPANGSSSVVNTPVTVSANAADGDGTVTEVRFFDGAAVIGIDSTSPYSISWTPTVTGAHSLTARATDDDNATTTSTAVNVTVNGGGGGDTQAPTVSLNSPDDGTRDLSGTITASATASDNVGVVGVEFQLDGQSIGEDLTAPYTMTLPSLSGYADGSHQVRARARDAAGNRSAWDLARVSFNTGATITSGFSRTTFVQNLGTVATAITFAPDGRLFICEQGGDLRVVKNGALLSTPFVHVNTTADGERGLLGVAFHPNFASNNLVYVYYTSSSGGTPHNRISRFTAAGDVAVPGSEQVLVELPNLSSATYHNGGAIHFGPDGKLYAALGDNGLGSNAQSNSTRLGKVLRFNDDGTIPADNPSIGTGVNKAIWAMGFRNPFTFSFQPGTGRMFINDVGEESWEEVNEGAAGANYGWPTTEGATSNPAFTSPLFTYAHSGQPISDPTLLGGLAIVGSAFYNPSTVLFPTNYVGSYFFADYVKQFVVRLDLATANNAAYTFAQLPNSVTDLAVGSDGALYLSGIMGNGSWGVWRITH